MAFVTPDIDDFFERYPEFEAVDEDRVDRVLEWAISEVGPTWIEKDRVPAILALTASTLDEESTTDASESISGGVASGPITSETVGPLSVKYQTGKQSADAVTRTAVGSSDSAYMALFKMLRKRSFPPIGII